MGNIYKRPNTHSWWLDYQDAQGKRIRRSANTTDEQVARQKLQQATPAVKLEEAAPDLLQGANPEKDIERNENLTEKVALLEKDATALKQRQSYYERELERLLRNSVETFHTIRAFATRFAYAREALMHAAAEMGDAQLVLVKLISSDAREDADS
jgi:hypothetical protein